MANGRSFPMPDTKHTYTLAYCGICKIWLCNILQYRHKPYLQILD